MLSGISNPTTHPNPPVELWPKLVQYQILLCKPFFSPINQSFDQINFREEEKWRNVSCKHFYCYPHPHVTDVYTNLSEHFSLTLDVFTGDYGGKLSEKWVDSLAAGVTVASYSFFLSFWLSGKTLRELGWRVRQVATTPLIVLSPFYSHQ